MHYNVQTTVDAFVYFNYFVHNNSIEEIMKKLIDVSNLASKSFKWNLDEEIENYTLKKEVKEEEELSKKLRGLLDEFQDEVGETYEMLQFFPSLSDSSYIKIDDDEESIDKLIKNFPQYKNLYNVPLHEIKKLNISAVNYGCYGKYAHKWSERIYKPYSFGVLPKLIIKTVEKFM